jgi:hypothetical protein
VWDDNPMLALAHAGRATGVYIKVPFLSLLFIIFCVLGLADTCIRYKLIITTPVTTVVITIFLIPY